MRVLDIAGEARPVPQHDAAFGDLTASEVGDHGLKGGAAGGGCAGAGFVFVDGGEGELALLTPVTEGRFLLGERLLLLASAAVAQVGSQVGAGGKGGLG